jgi:hypothetical protein
MLARHRVNRSPVIVAFALFALLFILGLLFSSGAGVRVKRSPAPPPPAHDSSVEGGGGSWGDDHAGSTQSTSQRQDSRKPKW